MAILQRSVSESDYDDPMSGLYGEDEVEECFNAASKANICATTDNCFEYIKPFFHYVSKYQGGHGGFGDILYQLMLMDKDELEIYK